MRSSLTTLRNLTTTVLRTALLATVALATVDVTARSAAAQDNILIYGNSIINGPFIQLFNDLIVQAGVPAPNIVSSIVGGARTGNHVGQLGLVTSSLPAGQTWRAMVVQGSTFETTDYLTGDVAAFHANMQTMADAYFAHSPNGLFIGHETGADHPTSNRYPSWFADPATWLAFPQAAYAHAAEVITAAHPASPPMQIAKQGTCWANTIGYELDYYQNDLHHLNKRGKILVACLYYLEIYGGRIADIPVDFSVSTPFVDAMIAGNIDEAMWDKIVGYADRSQRPAMRPFPGSNSDFQLRTGTVADALNVRAKKYLTSGDGIYLQLVSPLHALDTYAAGVYLQILPTGTLPTMGAFPGLHLDRSQMTSWFAVPDLTGSAVLRNIPNGLAGNTIWVQGTSRGPSGSPAFPDTFSDAQQFVIQ